MLKSTVTEVYPRLSDWLHDEEVIVEPEEVIGELVFLDDPQHRGLDEVPLVAASLFMFDVSVRLDAFRQTSHYPHIAMREVLFHGPERVYELGRIRVRLDDVYNIVWHGFVSKVVGGSPRKDTGIMTDKRNTEK